jgi:hypothetical protein
LPSLSSDTSEQEKTPKPKPIAKKPINVAGLKMTSKVKPLSASALASSSSSQEESGEGVTLFQRGTIARDITGAKLANPNPVFQRLYSLDPVLFPKNKCIIFNTYGHGTSDCTVPHGSFHLARPDVNNIFGKTLP